MDKKTKYIKVARMLVVQDNKILFIRRKDGSWEFPGGKVEKEEDPALAATRELEEETGLKCNGLIQDLWFAYTRYKEKDYITYFFKAGNYKGEPKLMEPDHIELKWFPFDKLPRPVLLVKPVAKFLKHAWPVVLTDNWSFNRTGTFL